MIRVKAPQALIEQRKLLASVRVHRDVKRWGFVVHITESILKKNRNKPMRVSVLARAKSQNSDI